jgi:hypothetical protein
LQQVYWTGDGNQKDGHLYEYHGNIIDLRFAKNVQGGCDSLTAAPKRNKITKAI